MIRTFKVVFMPIIRSLEKKSFSMISRLEIILSSCERKIINFYQKSFKITKNNTFNNVF